MIYAKAKEIMLDTPEYLKPFIPKWDEYLKKQALRTKQSKYYLSEKSSCTKRQCYGKKRYGKHPIKLYGNPLTNKTKMEWHHINNTYIVALPYWLHRMYGTSEQHKNKIFPLVIQLYPNLIDKITECKTTYKHLNSSTAI